MSQNAYFSFIVFVCSMSECVVLFQIDFTSTNSRKGENSWVFIPNCPNLFLNVRVSKFLNSIFWQCHFLINKSNQLLVIVFHQLQLVIPERAWILL